MERYRQRRARKLARKAARRGGHGPTTWESWMLRPTFEDYGLVGPDEVKRFLWADAEGPDDQRDALDQKQYAEHERDGERRSDRRTQ